MKTVQELIDELSKIEDKTAPVLLDGCDCIRSWDGIVTKYTTDGFNKFYGDESGAMRAIVIGSE